MAEKRSRGRTAPLMAGAPFSHVRTRQKDTQKTGNASKYASNFVSQRRVLRRIVGVLAPASHLSLFKFWPTTHKGGLARVLTHVVDVTLVDVALPFSVVLCVFS
jgi:hypothetical protein